ncbi:MAG: hypothetical protein HOE48_19970 [Candidatus Latescibacteria bacterium]|jgi:hypothetical protein|nr:hypothetical protein [Candidatus Latescibacterota bacterium]MBT4140203.1 hypothetical protein [Candidatus Latescibacterota bacterium]
MHRTVSTTAEFLQKWDSRINFLLAGECVPFSFSFPSTQCIVERLVEEDKTTAIVGQLRNTTERENLIENFRGMSFGALMETSFQFRYPDVTLLDRPGDIFEGFTEQVLIPWKQYLLDNGFEWDRCYALARVSGPNTSTGYHMDRSNVLFWNVRGRKAFHGFTEPDRWVPIEQSIEKRISQVMPEGVLDEDILTYDVGDNQLLWNHLMTPHWVDAPELTFGINFSLGGLRHNGRLCRYEENLYDSLGKNPNESWHPETSSVAFQK